MVYFRKAQLYCLLMVIRFRASILSGTEVCQIPSHFSMEGAPSHGRRWTLRWELPEMEAVLTGR